MAMTKRSRYIAGMTVGYAGCSMLWIVFSDRLLADVADAEAALRLSMAKGLLFIIVTAALLFLALQAVPPERDDLPPAETRHATSAQRRFLAILLPLVAFGVQWGFWDFIKPYVWLLFFPAVFLSSWIGGLGSGVAATFLSTILVWFFFIPPRLSFTLESPISLFSIGVFFAMGVLFSLTHERLRRAERKAADMRFRALVEQSLVGMYIIQGGRFRYVNQGFCDIFGYPAPQALIDRLPVMALIAPEDRERVIGFLYPGGGKEGRAMRFSFAGMRRDGGCVEVEAHGRDLEFQGAPARIGVVLDVSEGKQAKEQASREQAQLEAVFQSIQDGIVVSDMEGNFFLINEAQARINGFPSPEAMKANLALYADLYELAFPDGQPVPVDEWPISRILRGETLSELELRGRRRDTGREWYFSFSGAPVRNGRGEQILAVVVTRDITARKRAEAELAALNRDLETRVRARTAELEAANAELDSFAYAVSHDLRAPLRAMAGFAQALEEDFGNRLDGEAREDLAQIVVAARRMGTLIDGLFTLSRVTRGDIRRDAVDLSLLAEEVLADLLRGEPVRQVAWFVEPGLTANGDERMIEALLRNLLSNAWKYTRDALPAEIHLYGTEQDGQRKFCVADNGVGFDMAHAGRLFKPFQRLHRQDEFPGVGIGLATVHRIVHRHGGEIHVTAQPGRGATFCFSLAPAGRDVSAEGEA